RTLAHRHFLERPRRPALLHFRLPRAPHLLRGSLGRKAPVPRRPVAGSACGGRPSFCWLPPPLRDFLRELRCNSGREVSSTRTSNRPSGDGQWHPNPPRAESLPLFLHPLL